MKIGTKVNLGMLAMVMAMLLAAPCQAGLEATMRVSGAVQGVFEAGGNTIDPMPGSEFSLVSFTHSASRTYDAASGIAGSVQQAPFEITKYADRASPRLWQAFLSNEPLSCVLEVKQDMPDGGNAHYYTIQLTNARVVDIRDSMASASPAVSTPHLQTVKFAFDRIAWIHEQANVSAMDNR